MSAWRRVAIEHLPEFKHLVEGAWSPMALWMEFRSEFERAFAEGKIDVLNRILAFAKWCWASPSGDVVNAVACGFFEHLPIHRGIRASLPRFFSRDEFSQLKDVFAYHAGPEIVHEIEQEYRRARN
jgi:hypothetical protein